MSQREVLIILAHAQFCDPCRQRLLSTPDTVFIGRLLTDEEKAALVRLTEADFSTPERLVQTTGSATVSELDRYRDNPVARLRHFWPGTG